MRKVYIYLMLLAGVALQVSCSKFSQTESVIDQSFTVASSVKMSTEHMCDMLVLSLDKGNTSSVSSTFRFSYSIEGNVDAKIKNLDGNEVESGGEIKLTRETSCSYLLPNLATESSRIFLEFERLGLYYRDTVQFHNGSIISLDINDASSLDKTVVTLRNNVPDNNTDYIFSFFLDGNPFSGMLYQGHPLTEERTFNFSRQDAYDFEISQIAPGPHTLRVEVKVKGSYDKTIELSSRFNEPNRNVLQVVISYIESDKRMVISSPNNTLNVPLNIKCVVTAASSIQWKNKKGQVNYKFFDHYSNSFSVENIIPGRIPQPIDGIGSNSTTLYGMMDWASSEWAEHWGKERLYSWVESVSFDFIIESKGPTPGNTQVNLTPRRASLITIPYYYTRPTWHHTVGTRGLIKVAKFHINGSEPENIHVF